MNAAYVRTVQLLLDVAPSVLASSNFALKGGTALNLFLQDMPRLSVDIDIVFTRHDLGRQEALSAIAGELDAVRRRVEAMGYAARVPKAVDGADAKLFIHADGIEVKAEVNFVFRGAVLPIERRSLCRGAQQKFAANIELPILAPAELYAGKLVAALDRQHPRDLFDVKLMLETGHEWVDEMLDCFVVYLAGHNRPMHEVLFPNLKPLEAIFSNEFAGMTAEPIELEALQEVRIRMLNELPRALLPRHREFLLSVARAEPDWSLLAYGHVQHLPAMQWKLLNLAKLRRNKQKFAQQHTELAERLRALD